MPHYPYHLAFSADERFGPVVNLPIVEANTPFEAVDKLRFQGLLPSSQTPLYVRVITEVHDNGIPAKVISVQLVPLREHVTFVQQ
jgi:hypothetical protein